MSAAAVFLIKGSHLKVTKLSPKGLRFKCRRCGTFCCRLGGPVVTSDDVVRLKRSCPDIENATETVVLGRTVGTVLVAKPNGECIFFQRRGDGGVCSVYNHRPDVCRTYPFRLVREGNSLIVSLLPCVGLNTKEGRLLNGKLIREYLQFATAT